MSATNDSQLGPPTMGDHDDEARRDAAYQAMSYRLWVNEARTVLVRLWENGTLEVATRETPDHIWGPPVYLTEEKVS
jgi:hypothetical protein